MTGMLAPLRDVVEIQLTRVKAHLVMEPELSLIDYRLRRVEPGGSTGQSTRNWTLARGAHAGRHHARPPGSRGQRPRAGRSRRDGPHPPRGRGAAPDELAGRGAAARRGPRLFAAMTPEPPAFQPIEDGDVLPMLGGLRVIHTPGHTPGSVCLYGARDRVLFVGDTLQRRFGRVSFASGLYSDDHAAARRAMKRLAELDVETVVFSHYAALRRGSARHPRGLASRAG